MRWRSAPATQPPSLLCTAPLQALAGNYIPPYKSWFSSLSFNQLNVHSLLTVSQLAAQRLHLPMANTTQPQQYEHYALDLRASQQCIRLLDILPDRLDGTVRCSLLPEKQVALTDATKQSYVAISYECGDPESAKHNILINNKGFTVLDNLHTLLVNLQGRYADGKQDLWIDAISIDQTNLAEKHHQVQLMKAIYKKAHHVLCWLGPAGDRSDEVFDLLNQASIPIQPECTAADSLRSIARTKWNDLHSALFNAGLFQPKIIEPFVALTKRGYWSKRRPYVKLRSPQMMECCDKHSKYILQAFACLVPATGS